MSRVKIIPQEPPKPFSPRHHRGKGAKKANPFAQRLKALRPKTVKYAPHTTPDIESTYQELENILSCICGQFKDIPRVDSLLYRQLSLGTGYLVISQAQEEQTVETQRA